MQIPCVLCFIMFLLLGCDNSGLPNSKAKRQWAAKVGERYLYVDELAGIVPEGMTGNDSIRLIGSFVENWVKKELMVQEAEKSKLVNEKDLKKRLEEYRSALLTHEFQKEFVTKNMDDSVSDEEISNYYIEHKEDFKLREPIVKAYLIKIAANLLRSEDLEALIKKSRPQDNKEEIKLFCQENALQFQLVDDQWISFKRLIISTPFEEEGSPRQLLTRSNYFMRNDGNYDYYLRVLEYKLNEETAPLAFAETQIKDIIRFKRRKLLLEKLENDIFEKARQNNAYEIQYNNERR